MKKEIAIITSTEATITSFLKDYIIKLSKIYSVTIIVNVKNETFISELFEPEKVKIIKLKISREISYLNDLRCLLSLFKIFYTKKFDIIFSITPKAGLLSMISGFLSRTKFRLHYFTGQVWVTRTGFQRFFLRNVDRLMGYLATHVLTDSNSQKKFLEDENIIKKNRLKVLANGSICGVNTEQFKPDLELKKKIRKELNIPDDAILLLFLGRLNRDKGVLDLAQVVNNLNATSNNNNIHLLIIGPDEENIKFQVQKLCQSIIEKIHFIDFTDRPEKFMTSADIFCLPSYREGFGMAALEAGACALPTVTSRIYGLTDAVSENETGLFHEPGDLMGMADSILKLINDKNLRIEMGQKGRERTKNLFEKKYVTSELVNFINYSYKKLLKKKIIIISSTEISIRAFLLEQIKMLNNLYDITVVTNFVNKKRVLEDSLSDVKFINMNIQREISYIDDLVCFVKLIILFLKNRYDLVFSITPKGGFLSMCASYSARIKNRVHWYGGQVWVTRTGFQRFFLRNIDKLMGFMATNVLTECNSQKKFLEDENIIKKNRLKVLANGSICGVNTEQFKPDLELKKKIRKELNIPDDAILLLFLGRLNRDKGVLDLAQVVNNLNATSNNNNNIHLLIIGPDEENIKFQVQKICQSIIEKIHFIDFTDRPEKFMTSADIFCLPSYREGFGMAALEAGACALPTVTSRIYGLIDAVSENETGLFHEPGDLMGMADSILKLINDKNLRIEMGQKGRERTKNLFEKKYVTSEFVNYISNLT